MGTKVLLVYPEIPPTYWSMRYSMPFIGKKASIPPLGLMTVAAMLPGDFEVSLVDMNVTPLQESAVASADLVFVSAMIVQQDSLARVVQLCRKLRRPVVAGGPYATSSHERIEGIDHFVLNEAEVTLPRFLHDLRQGRPQPLYLDPARPDIGRTPPPRFDLIDTRDYATMALQYSRGCPHACEFCDIIELFGRVPRTKSPAQFLREMDAVYATGYRGSLFVVDDNFIGNRKNVKQLLPAISAWQRRREFPFGLFTEATITLAEDKELMDLMVAAGFNMVFLGIETPVEETLVCTKKMQNTRLNLLDCVRTIQRRGMEVSSGFIVGFDTDPADIFDRQIRFIQESGIPTAMVGLLNALPNTQLHRRLQAENRLLDECRGDNTHDLHLNFQPRMDLQQLLAGYKRVIAEIYRPERYFERCLQFLKNLTPHRTTSRRIQPAEIRAFLLSLCIQTFSNYGFQYWKFLTRAFCLKPGLLAETITMAVKGHHFFKVTRAILAVDNFKRHLETLSLAIQDRAKEMPRAEIDERIRDLKAYRDRALADIRREYRRLHKDFQVYVEEALANFETLVDDVIRAAAQGRPLGAPQG